MEYDYDKPKYAKLVAILEECARSSRMGPSSPSGYGVDVSDIDIVWLYEKLTELGADLKDAKQTEEN